MKLESKSKLAFLLVWFLLVGVVVSIGCGNKQPPEQPTQQPTKQPTATEQPISTLSTPKGVSLSPRSTQPKDFTDFFEKAKQTGEVIMWAGDWIELSNAGGGGPTVLAELASRYDYIPLLKTQFFSQ